MEGNQDTEVAKSLCPSTTRDPSSASGQVTSLGKNRGQALWRNHSVNHHYKAVSEMEEINL